MKATDFLDAPDTPVPAPFGPKKLSIADVLGPEPKAEPGVVSTMKRTGGQMLTGLGQTVEDVTGPNVATEALHKTGKEIIDANPAGIGSLSDIVENPWLTVKEAVGQMAPQIVAGMGGRMVGAKAGALLGSPFGPVGAGIGGVAGGLIGGVAPIFFQEYGGIREEQKEAGTEDKGRALLAATGASALEFLGPEGKLIRQGLKGAPTDQILREVGKAAGKGLVVEAPTESAQTIVEKWGAAVDPFSRAALEEAAVAGIMGGIGGGVVGGAARGAEAFLPGPEQAGPAVAPGEEPLPPLNPEGPLPTLDMTGVPPVPPAPPSAPLIPGAEVNPLPQLWGVPPQEPPPPPAGPTPLPTLDPSGLAPLIPGSLPPLNPEGPLPTLFGPTNPPPVQGVDRATGQTVSIDPTIGPLSAAAATAVANGSSPTVAPAGTPGPFGPQLPASATALPTDNTAALPAEPRAPAGGATALPTDKATASTTATPAKPEQKLAKAEQTTPKPEQEPPKAEPAAPAAGEEAPLTDEELEAMFEEAAAQKRKEKEAQASQAAGDGGAAPVASFSTEGKPDAEAQAAPAATPAATPEGPFAPAKDEGTPAAPVATAPDVGSGVPGPSGPVAKGGEIAKGGQAPANSLQRPELEKEREALRQKREGAVDRAAHEGQASPQNDLPQPSIPQIEAGVAKLGHPKVGGLDISIENPAGSIRKDIHNDPPKWQTKMRAHYGYIKGVAARSPDKEHVDVFVKEGTPEDWSGPVFVIDQNKGNGQFDEPKVMIGWPKQGAAMLAYLRHYEKGWSKRVRGITELSWERFQAELQDKQAFLKPHSADAKPTKQAQRTDAISTEQAGKDRVGLEKMRESLRQKREEQTAKSAKKMSQTVREAERHVFANLLTGDGVLELAGQTELPAFTEKAQAVVAARIERAIRDGGDPDWVRAIKGMLADGKPTLPEKFYAALHKEARQRWAEAQKEQNRDPGVYQGALAAAFLEFGKVRGASEADFDAFKLGFDHALKGKTKSSLPSDGGAQFDGYKAARAWIGTDAGRAWFEGKPGLEKEQSTGEALRRRQDRLRRDLSSVVEGDMDKAWERLKVATARADWFDVALGDGATPGVKAWLADLRDKLATFPEFFMAEAMDDILRTRKHSPTPIQALTGRFRSDSGRFSDANSDADRIRVAKEIAQDYQSRMQAIADRFKGVTRLEQVPPVVHSLFGSTQAGWRDTAWARENASLLRQNTYALGYFLPFEPDNNRDWRDRLKAEDREAAPGDRAAPLVPPRLDRVTRTGLADHRGGRDISAKEFKAAFGFADVTIGGYVTAEQARDHLNYSYDAFMDLAALLGAKPNQIGFGGHLHFAIGALGQGKHAAHFAPAQPRENGAPVPVINVTNTRGDGTVLHEYFHAIDFLTTDQALKDAIADVKILFERNPLAPDEAVRIAEDFLKGGRFFPHLGKRSGVKVHAKYALSDYYRSGKKATTKTAFFSEAQKLDAGRGTDPYWSNKYEPWARMAEAWGGDTLAARGGRSDYLVNQAWSGDGVVQPPKFRGIPYPMGEERKRLVALMQQFVEQAEWTNDGPRLKADSSWQRNTPWDTAMADWQRACDDAARNLDQIAEDYKQREAEKEAERQREKDKEMFGEPVSEPSVPGATDIAADTTPPTDSSEPASADVTLSESELSAMFDEAAAQVRESTQEQPAAPGPGEAALPDRWTIEDVQELVDAIEKNGDIILVAGTDLGIPTIHSVPSDVVHHVGFGMFEVKHKDYEGSFDAGGAMLRTPSGHGYTRVYMGRGTLPFWNRDEVLGKLKRMLNAAKMRQQIVDRGGKAPEAKGPELDTLDAAQQKTAAALAAEAAKLGVKGVDEELKGLVKLFGGGRIQSFPGGFDEETYKAAKPHFEAMLKAFQDAGKTIKDMFRLMIEQWGEGVKAYAIRFAQEKQLTANLNRPKPPAAPEPNAPVVAGADNPSRNLADWVRSRLAMGHKFDWKVLFDKADEFFGGTQADGRYTPKDAYDAVELGVNRWLLYNWGAKNTALNVSYTPTRARDAIKMLGVALQNVPTQTKRTAEMDEFQQFSTPPTYAFLANWVAGVRPGDVYLEPSAGVGGLAVFGKLWGASTVAVNELSPRRLALLRELPFDQFYAENAEHLSNILPADLKPTVIVMNPPFSATAGRKQGERDTMNGARHIEEALKKLAPGGRLVAIVGEGMADDRPAFKAWWKKIKADYNVRANVGIDGAGYAKYGTTFDNQLLVIDNDGPTTETVVTGKVDSPADAVDLLKDIHVSRPEQSESAAPTQPGSAPGSQPGSGAAAGAGQRPAPPGVPGGGGSSGLGGGQGVGLGAGPESGGTTAGRPQLPSGAQPGGAGVSAPDGGTGRGGAAGVGASLDAEGSRGGDTGAGSGSTGGIGVSVRADETRQDFTNSIFENYAPKKVEIAGAQPHNTPLVESAAMASVDPPNPTYRPNLPRDIIDGSKPWTRSVYDPVERKWKAETTRDAAISIAQLESVVYAGQAHAQKLTDGSRRGFFIGDGTGVGKGREISAIILDNMRQGRKKAVWVSQKAGLMEDAKRDFGNVGGDVNLIFSHHKQKIGAPLPSKDGILFTAYSLLRGATSDQRAAKKAQGTTPSGSRRSASVAVPDRLKGQNIDPREAHLYQYERVNQIVEWLGKDYDGLIVFDEAHNMANAIPSSDGRGLKEAAAQALAALALQQRMPNARILYVSATGATEVKNLAYAPRLGLWGPGTPFQTMQQFVDQVSRSIASMELVAQNLKQMGLYVARSLSFDGGTPDTRVTYNRVEHQLTDYQRDVYDTLARSWQMVLQNLQKALIATGVLDHNGASQGSTSGQKKGAVLSAFWGAHQRFFNQIITSLQMPSVLEAIEADLKDGKSVVLQLTNTGEADQNRALAKLKGQKPVDAEDDDSVEELDMTPRDGLISFIRAAWPVEQFEDYVDDNGNTQVRPVLDSQGKPVINKAEVEAREAAVKMVENMQIPDSPLQGVVNHFGPDVVAEITGRGERPVPQKEGGFKLEKRGDAAVAADAQAFKDGKKRVLIFSNAGGTGFSFHSDRTYKNQQKRAHYILQAGWSADKAMQGLGRSHRTNQRYAPEYRLVTTDIPAQKRFISSIARRLEQLGALTTGQRDTAGGSLFSAADNLESAYATRAVRTFFANLLDRGGSRYAQIEDVDALLRELGLEKVKNRDGGLAESNLPKTTQFLNRLLSLTLPTQEVVFSIFADEMEQQIEIDRVAGRLDDGMKTVRHVGASVATDDVVYEDQRTGAKTHYLEVDYKQPNRFYEFDDTEAAMAAAIDAGRVAGWFKNKTSGKVASIFATGTTRTNKYGHIQRVFALVRTSGRTTEAESDVKDKWDKIDAKEARRLWESENAVRPKTLDRKLHMVVGGILPLWDRFNNDTVEVARIRTDDGRRFLGRVIKENDLDATLSNLNVKSAAARMTGAELVRAVMGGAAVAMSNRWRLERVTVSGEKRIEIIARGLGQTVTESRRLEEAGAFMERIQFQQRWFVPSSATAGGAAIDKLMETFAMTPTTVGGGGSGESGGSGIVGKAESGMLFAARQAPRSKLDTLLWSMANRGATSRELLDAIAKHSEVAGNRRIASLIRALGVSPRMEVGANEAALEIRGREKFAGKFVAAYSPKSDTVFLLKPGATESDLLHEFVHAATMKGIRAGGQHARAMQMLYQRVKRNAAFQAYGLENIDEFIAEAMSNPEFQAALQAMPAQHGAFRNAWEWFRDLVRQILGLKALEHGTALEQALRIGERVMEEEARSGGRVEDVTLGKVDQQIIRDKVQDLFVSQRTFNRWWHRTVGTQYHKASVDKDFKRVFDLGQTYLQDTSQFAMDAADLAPDLLPRMESLRDLLKYGAKAADVEAIRAPIFEGTLADAKVYTDAELRNRFKLTDKQIGLYRQARSAINRSLDDLAVSEMIRLAKPLSLESLDRTLFERMQVAELDSAYAMVDSVMRTRFDNLMLVARRARDAGDEASAKDKEAQAQVVDDARLDIERKHGRIVTLKAQGYAPLMRFGQYTVDMYRADEDGKVERLYFGMFETQAEANAMARQMRQLVASDPDYEGAVVDQGLMAEEAWRAFRGISPDSLEVFAEAIGAEESDVFQEYLRAAINNRSALKRLIQRQGVPGFSKDVQRVLAQFVTSNARLAARNLSFGDMLKAAAGIPKAKGDVKDEAMKLVEYLQNPKEEAAGVRSLLFVHFLGGSVASALVNATQPVTMTFPYLAQWGGRRAGAALRKAGMIAAGATAPDDKLAAAMSKAEKEGVVAPHEIHQLYAEAIRGLGSNIWLRRGLRVWGSFFSLAEAFNRRITFAAAFDMARQDAKLGNPFAFAVKAVEETQGIYNRGNRPNWARGPVGATVFTFKQFSIAYLEFLKRLPPRERALALAILFVAAGLEGMPFAEDFGDLIDTIGQFFGYNTNAKRSLEETAARHLGHGLGAFVTHGFSAIPGVPLDVQARMGLGNLIPGTAILKKSEADKTRDVLEFLGPAGGLVTQATRGYERLEAGDYRGMLRSMAPVAAQNAITAVDMHQTGTYRDTRGRVVTDVSGADAAIKAIGFHPAKVAAESRKVQAIMQSIQTARAVESDIASQWAAGIFERDLDKVQNARMKLQEWNLKNPGTPIRITPEQVVRRVREMKSSRSERVIRGAPPELRGQVRRELVQPAP